MAAATEMERLLVRLTGDGSSYQRMLKKSTQDTEKFRRDVNGKLRDVRGKFVAEQSRIRASLALTGKMFTGFGLNLTALGRGFRNFGSSLRRFGSRLLIGLTLPLTVIGGLAVRSFAKFDQAMTESTSIMKVTIQQTERMREVALDLSTRAVQGPSELAESYFFLASAGKTAAQSMALLPKVSQFATAGAFDMALATDLLTDAQSALGLSTKNVAQDTLNLSRVADVLVKANTLANASVRQFSTALTSKAGAALKSFGKDVEEGVAVLAALADQGVKAELAGNALDRVIRLASKGALDNAKAHKRLGFEVFDNAGKMRNLGDIIGNLEEVLKGLSDKQRAATLDMLGFEARVQGVILPLLGTSKAIKEYERQLRKAGGTTDDVANKQLRSFSNQMKIIRNQVTAVGIDIGERLVPVLEVLTGFIKDGVRWWKSLSDNVKRASIAFTIILAVVGPLLIALGAVVSILALVASAFANMFSISGVAMVASIVAVSAALLALASPAISGIFIALTEWNGTWFDALRSIQTFAEGAGAALGNFEQSFRDITFFMKTNWELALNEMTRFTKFFLLDILQNLAVFVIAFHKTMFIGFDQARLKFVKKFEGNILFDFIVGGDFGKQFLKDEPKRIQAEADKLKKFLDKMLVVPGADFQLDPRIAERFQELVLSLADPRTHRERALEETTGAGLFRPIPREDRIQPGVSLDPTVEIKKTNETLLQILDVVRDEFGNAVLLDTADLEG